MPAELPVSYCTQYFPKLGPTDPTMNFGLLGLLSGKDDKYLIQEFGVDYIDALKALAWLHVTPTTG